MRQGLNFSQAQGVRFSCHRNNPSARRREKNETLQEQRRINRQSAQVLDACYRSADDEDHRVLHVLHVTKQPYKSKSTKGSANRHAQKHKDWKERRRHMNTWVSSIQSCRWRWRFSFNLSLSMVKALIYLPQRHEVCSVCSCSTEIDCEALRSELDTLWNLQTFLSKLLQAFFSFFDS